MQKHFITLILLIAFCNTAKHEYIDNMYYIPLFVDTAAVNILISTFLIWDITVLISIQPPNPNSDKTSNTRIISFSFSLYLVHVMHLHFGCTVSHTAVSIFLIVAVSLLLQSSNCKIEQTKHHWQITMLKNTIKKMCIY